MSTAPRGMSVQEAYRLYRGRALFVNRKYQRKLVWTEAEKARLVDSLLKGFPVPLILLAEDSHSGSTRRYEIIDGLQRLNAIFSYIENAFALDGDFFDLQQFAHARQIAEEGRFTATAVGSKLLSPQQCANLLDY